ncbi:MAG: T9SS type A sorting domain-containing protein [Chitinophagales bacterium]
MKTIHFILIRFVLTWIALPPANAVAQTPDWSTTVASIVYNHCSHCHHDGGIGPFSLMSYEDANTWGFSMVIQINAKLMPPWPPDASYNHLKDENVLSENEISAINSWVNNYMPVGDINLAPAPPVFDGSSLMVNPDDIYQLPVFTLPSDGNVYWRFVNQPSYYETKYLNSVEFVAGNPSVIHHVTLGLDHSGLAWEDDLNYPGPGCPRDFGSNPAVSVFMSQSEGRITSLPENIGFEVLAGDDYVSDIHYFADSTGEMDSSKVNVKYCNAPNPRAVKTEKTLYGKEPSLLDGPLEIPANTVKTFHLESSIFTEDKSLLGLGPHSHVICKSWKVYMVIPSGDTVPLISIPHWDFDWQGSYLLTKVIKIPQGSKVYGTVEYDNTTNNPDNPSNPPEDVYGNGSMLGEMAQVHLWMMDYQEGDEDIILDSAFYGYPTGGIIHKPADLFTVFPNPASQKISIAFTGSNGQEVKYSVYNNFGERMAYREASGVEGNYSIELDCNAFPSGIYLLSVHEGENVYTKKFVILK